MRHLAWLLPTLLSCGTNNPPDFDGGVDAGAECLGVAPRTLEQVFPAYFAAAAPTGCVSACHGIGSGSLTFSTATEFWQATRLKPSPTGHGMLVTPFSPKDSWLFQKLGPDAPTRMPAGGTFLSSAQLGEVEGWICAGAPGPAGATGGGAGGGGGSGGGSGGGGGAVLTVSGFSPGSGVVGTAVTVSGQGFSPVTAQDTVKFNGTSAPVLAATATTLAVNVPTGAATGPISVTVGAQTASSSSNFTASVGNPKPTLTALSPCGKVAGSGGFTLTISGSNFMAGSTVTFNGTALAVTNATATLISATVPAAAVATAPAGNTAQVVVSNSPPGGGSSAPTLFGVASATSTLAATVQAIFTASCLNAGCHTTAGLAGGLDLTSANARASLVGAPSAGCSSRIRVVSCNPSRAVSVLADKILATPTSAPCSGTAMPKGAPLTAAEKQKIVDWIAQGAP